MSLTRLKSLSGRQKRKFKGGGQKELFSVISIMMVKDVSPVSIWIVSHYFHLLLYGHSSPYYWHMWSYVLHCSQQTCSCHISHFTFIPLVLVSKVTSISSLLGSSLIPDLRCFSLLSQSQYSFSPFQPSLLLLVLRSSDFEGCSFTSEVQRFVPFI